MAGNLILGLWYILAFLIICVEYYFIVLEKYTEEETGRIHFLILTVSAVLSFYIQVRQIISRSFGLLPVLLIPLSYLIIRTAEELHQKNEQKQRLKKDISTLLRAIKKTPGNAQNFISLGDLYYREGFYEKALHYYKAGHTIDGTPKTLQKVKAASRDLKIKKGDLWVCRECRRDNPPARKKCTECGSDRNALPYFIKDLSQNREIIKNWVLKWGIVPLVVALFLALLRRFVSFGAFAVITGILFLLLIAIALKKLFSW